jgi:hypothetical protein
MDFMIDENQPFPSPLTPNVVRRRLNMRSHIKSPNRLSVPDLSETDQSTESDERDVPTVRIL